MSLYLSRLTLRRDPSAAALNALIEPREEGRARDGQHRLIWSAYAEAPPPEGRLLWREAAKGVFLVLAPVPAGQGPLFAPPEVRPFAPELRQGDRLAFQLRANATKDRAHAKSHRRVDVVMDALHAIPPAERAARRGAVAQAEGARWLAGQGERHGFRLPEVTVEDYTVSVLPGHMGRRAGQPQFGILDLTGVLEVTDPVALLARIGAGFGRARAFGCGLMLLRRV